MISFFHKKSCVIDLGKHLPEFLQPIDADSFLEEHDTLVSRLKLAYSDTQSWETKILPCIRSLALMCGRLPYSATGIFSDVNSLFKAGVTAATYAIEIMEGSVQLEKNIMAQHLLQGRLKAVAALAGLCAFLDVFDRKLFVVEKAESSENPFFHISETNHIKHLGYEPLAIPYVTWVIQKLSTNPKLQLQLQWNTSPVPISQTRLLSRLFYARHVITPKTMAWLSDAGRLPLLELMKCLTIDTDVETLPSSVVKARNLGVYRTCLLERERIGAKLGEILTPDGWQETLIRILRARILNDWTINAKDSPLKRGADGLFLFWPDVCAILIDDMKTFGLTDLPTDPDIWAGCLLDSGITLPSKKETPTCWIAVTPNAKPREAIKLSDAYFFTSGRILYEKSVKREFEIELPIEQSVALTRLTREVLQATNGQFTQKLPESTPKEKTLIWQLKPNKLKKEWEVAPATVLQFLTQHPELVPELLIDEGIFLPNQWSYSEELSFERLVTSLLASGCIYETEHSEPLWVTHADSKGENHRGVILRPDLIEGLLDEKTLDFKALFESIHHRALNPRFAFLRQSTEESDQLSLNFEGDNSDE